MTTIAPVSIENLEGGNALQEVNEALAIIARDVIERSALDKPRKVTLEIMITPGIEIINGQPENIPFMEWRVKQALPPVYGIQSRGFIQRGEARWGKSPFRRSGNIMARFFRAWTMSLRFTFVSWFMSPKTTESGSVS